MTRFNLPGLHDKHRFFQIDPDLLSGTTLASPTIADSFDALADDIYCKSRDRKRRYSRYHALPYGSNRWHVRRLPHLPFFQSNLFNAFAGNIRRNYEPIVADLTPLLGILIQRAEFSRECGWRVGAHQIRVSCSAQSIGTIVPEGDHQDGFMYVMICVVSRSNISGGDTDIVRQLNPRTATTYSLEPGHVVVIDDRDAYHYTHPIEIAETQTQSTGYRDALVLTFEISHGNLR